MPKERWQIFEDYVSATFPGAKKTKDSGQAFGDGDLTTERFHIECKCRGDTAAIGASKDEILKTLQQATDHNRQPVMIIENMHGEKWAMLPYAELVRLLESLRSWEDTSYVPDA